MFACGCRKIIPQPLLLFLLVEQETMLNELQEQQFDVMLVTDFHVRECAKR